VSNEDGRAAPRLSFQEKIKFLSARIALVALIGIWAA
jgi:hypothetical protein